MQSVLNEDSMFDILNTVLSTVNKITNRDSNGKNNKQYIGGSISRYAKNLTMSFPVLVDDSLSVESAQMISKANEKNIASMLELLFASMSINANKNTTGKDVIGMFHKNIDDMSADDYIDYANNLVNSYKESVYLPKLTAVEIRQIQNEMTAVLKQPAKSFPVNSFSERSLNDYMCREMGSSVIVYEHVVTEDIAEYKYNLDVAKFNYQQEKDRAADEYQKEKDRYQQTRDYVRDDQADRDYRLRKDDYQLKRDQFNHNLHKDSRDKYRQDRRDNMSRYQDDINLNQRRILDSDFKKANELQPTLMMVNFNVLGPNGDGGETVIDRKTFVAGVKCRMIATGTVDIIERLLSTNKTQLSFKNLIRATTGEIKLGKDFLLAVDQQKLDAINDVKKGPNAKLWSTLKKRSTKGNYRKIARDKNDATAITTLVVSQDTVNLMIAEDKFDLNNTKNAKMVMDRYNLLCLVIADETNEVAKFMYDGNNDFESISYLVLSREAKDRELRKATDMLYRGGR